MTRFVRGLGQHPRTIGQALVVVIGVILVLEILSPLLPVLGNPLVLLASSLLALGILYGARATR